MLVHNKGKYVRHVGGVMLIPGGNDVTENELERIQAHKLARFLIEKGELVVPEQGKAKDITNLNATEAIELVKDTFNIQLLKDWEEKEQRKTVLKAIEDQVSGILNPKEDEDEE